MRSLLAMIFAMMVSFPGAAPAQQDQGALRRVHLMTGADTIPRNPANLSRKLRSRLPLQQKLPNLLLSLPPNRKRLASCANSSRNRKETNRAKITRSRRVRRDSAEKTYQVKQFRNVIINDRHPACPTSGTTLAR